MHGLDIRGLEIFLAVCDEGGLTSAARRLDLTQAAVSQHLAKIERELGVLLVDRSVRPQKITPAGDYLRLRGRKLFIELEEIRDGVARFRESDIPELRIGMIESVAVALLPHMVDRLNGKVGNLAVTSGTTHPLLPELRAGGFDMLVTSEGSEDGDGTTSLPLMTEPVVMILPKGTPAPRDWDEVNELAETLDFIPYGRKRRIGRLIERLLERFKIKTRGNLAFDSSFALLDRVHNGQGWAATTPLCILGAGLDCSSIEIVPFPTMTPLRCINLVWMAERPSGPSHLVARTCKDIFAERLIPLLRERAPGVEDRVSLAE
jgi:DNA-binding transcriptional LysR family regulator